MASDVPDVPNLDNESARNEDQSDPTNSTTPLLDAIDLFQTSRDYLLARGVKLNKQIPRGGRNDFISRTEWPRSWNPIFHETLDFYNYMRRDPHNGLTIGIVERSNDKSHRDRMLLTGIWIKNLLAVLFSDTFKMPMQRFIENPGLDSVYFIRVLQTNDIIFAGIGLTIVDIIKTWTSPCSDSDFISQIDRFPKDENMSETWISRFKEPEFKRHEGKVLVSGKNQEINITKIVFPYMRLESIKHNNHERKEVGKFMECFPIEKKTQFNGYNSIHVARTLDEAYYPGLSRQNSTKRNKDQVVTRQFENISSTAQKPILIVPQLWLWQLGNVLLLAYEGDWLALATSPECAMGNSIARTVHAFGTRAKYDKDSGEVPPTLDMFENALVTCLAEVDEYVQSEDSKKSMETKEYKFIHEIWDIRDELAMILEVLGQQMTIVDELLQVLDKRSEHCPELKGAKKLLERYIKRAIKMDKDAERIERGIQDRLNLRRTAASINEAQASVREARDAKLLSLSAVGFTIITFIFTPLSFIATLLALDIDWFSNIKHSTNATEIDGSGSDVYSGKKVIGIFIGTEIIAILLTIILGCLVAFLFFRFSDAPDGEVSFVSVILGKLRKRGGNVSNPESTSGKSETTGQASPQEQMQHNAPASDTAREEPSGTATAMGNDQTRSSGRLLQRLRGKMTGGKDNSPA